jgi:hypothetical protein
VHRRHALTYTTALLFYATCMSQERHMRDEERDELEESEEEQHARESEKAFDQAFTRIPPG